MSVLTSVTPSKQSSDNQELFETLDRIKRHGLGSMALVTEVKVVKRSRLTKEPTPSKYIDLRKVSYMVVSFHHDYEKGVRNRQAKVESDADPFTTQAPRGMHTYSENGVVLQSDRNPDQLYARFYVFTSNVHTKVVYIDTNDMPVEISRDEMGEYFTGYNIGGDKPESKKQAAAGIEKKDQVIVRSTKLESVQYFSKRKNKYSGRLFRVCKSRKGC